MGNAQSAQGVDASTRISQLIPNVMLGREGPQTTPHPQVYPPATIYHPYVSSSQQMSNYPGLNMAYPQPPFMACTNGLFPRAAPPTQEYEFTQTIKNQVGIKKHTLKVRPLDDHPSVLAISFKFNATAACRVTTYVVATEEPKNGFRISARQPVAAAVYYEPGRDLQFPPTAEAGDEHVIYTHLYGRGAELTTSNDNTHPVIIRLEALSDEGRAQNKSLKSVEPGSPLPKWIQSQTTYAKLIKLPNGNWDVAVTGQKIWVSGRIYDLQEIYGMETNQSETDQRTGEAAADGEPTGKECVICLTAKRDTTVMPCRHMCMCQRCAGVLRLQTNKCPICREEIESLLLLKRLISETGSASAASVNSTNLGEPPGMSSAVRLGQMPSTSIIRGPPENLETSRGIEEKVGRASSSGASSVAPSSSPAPSSQTGHALGDNGSVAVVNAGSSS